MSHRLQSVAVLLVQWATSKRNVCHATLWRAPYLAAAAAAALVIGIGSALRPALTINTACLNAATTTSVATTLALEHHNVDGKRRVQRPCLRIVPTPIVNGTGTALLPLSANHPAAPGDGCARRARNPVPNATALTISIAETLSKRSGYQSPHFPLAPIASRLILSIVNPF
jgi:hypothetical protein